MYLERNESVRQIDDGLLFVDFEVEKLKQAVESLMATNEEKVSSLSLVSLSLMYKVFNPFLYLAL